MSRRPSLTDVSSGHGPAGRRGAVRARRDLDPFLVLTGLGPGRLCAQWGIPATAWDAARRRSPETRPALRLYRLDLDGPVGSGVILFVDGPEGLRRIDAREGVFVAEFGLLHPDGRLDRLAASRPAAVPSAVESDDLSLAIVDVKNPPLVDAVRPHPDSQFLRLFSRGRHPQPKIRPDRRRAGHAVAHPPSVTPAVAAEAPYALPSLSGAGLEGRAAGWPLALRHGDAPASALQVPA